MKNVVEYLERAATKDPNKIAVVDEFGKCTYEELLKLSQKAGTFLINEGAVRVPVIVFMDKSIDALATFLGIAYADSTYTLINPGTQSTNFQVADYEVYLIKINK